MKRWQCNCPDQPKHTHPLRAAKDVPLSELLSKEEWDAMPQKYRKQVFRNMQKRYWWSTSKTALELMKLGCTKGLLRASR